MPFNGPKAIHPALIQSRQRHVINRAAAGVRIAADIVMSVVQSALLTIHA